MWRWRNCQRRSYCCRQWHLHRLHLPSLPVSPALGSPRRARAMTMTTSLMNPQPPAESGQDHGCFMQYCNTLRNLQQTLTEFSVFVGHICILSVPISCIHMYYI